MIYCDWEKKWNLLLINIIHSLVMELLRFFFSIENQWELSQCQKIGKILTIPKSVIIFAVASLKLLLQAGLSLSRQWREGGKSGQHRAMHRWRAGFAVVRGDTSHSETDSATENNCLPSSLERAGVRLKTWGKSSRHIMATLFAGKPCMLKCHIGQRSRHAG